MHLHALAIALFVLSLSVAACGSDDDPRPTDTAPADTQVAPDVAADSHVAPDAGADTVADTSEPDATTAPDATAPDAAAPDAIDAADAAGPTTTVAVLGARCDRRERVAIVEVVGPGSGQSHVSGWVLDRPFAWYGPPELTTESCEFHRMSTTPCGACGAQEICGFDGACAPIPVRLSDPVVVLSVGEESQRIEVDETYGDLYGAITSPGDTFAVELTFAEQRVTLEATRIPAPLADAAGVLEGDYDHPTGLDITWTAPEGDATVFSNIPINHHVGGPTFTECFVPASAAALHVGEAMLVPLAVVTGLEFQGISHVTFAAAETPAGCVELRLSGGQQFISLF